MELNFDNSEMDTMMLRKEDHHNEVSDLLNTIIEQNDKNNPEPILETIVQQNETIKETIDTTGKTIAQAIDQSKDNLKDVVSVLQVTKDFFSNVSLIKGEKGEKGDKGDRGEDGKDGRDGKDGKTPIAGIDFELPKDGRDGRDGRDGKDAEIDFQLVVSEIVKTIPKPKDGLPGKNGSPDTGEQIVNKLRALEYAKKLSYDDLKDAPDMAHIQRLISARDYDFTELKDAPSSYAGQAGKSIRVKSDEKGLEFFTSTTSIEFVDEEIPTGTIDGSNTDFELAYTPITGSVHLYLNGQRQSVNNSDYSITGTTITYATAPPPGSFHCVDYRK